MDVRQVSAEPEAAEDKVKPSLDHVKRFYDKYKTADTPSWDEIEGRVEKYLQHLFKEESNAKPAVVLLGADGTGVLDPDRDDHLDVPAV